MVHILPTWPVFSKDSKPGTRLKLIFSHNEQEITVMAKRDGFM